MPSIDQLFKRRHCDREIIFIIKCISRMAFFEASKLSPERGRDFGGCEGACRGGISRPFAIAWQGPERALLRADGAAFGAGGFGPFGHGSAVGGGALRRQERENAAPGIPPSREWRRLAG
jgi:hypothetical protein